MKKIDFSNLEPGDILLTTSHAAESWSVRFGTKGSPQKTENKAR